MAAPDAYRRPAEDPGARLAEDVHGAIQNLKRHGVRFSALIVDTIFSSDGVFADPPGFLAQAAAVAREAGGLFIADEVQPGFGRTGDAMWGFARHGLVPDLVVMGKPMGNGIPVAAGSSERLRSSLFQYPERGLRSGGQVFPKCSSASSWLPPAAGVSRLPRQLAPIGG